MKTYLNALLLSFIATSGLQAASTMSIEIHNSAESAKVFPAHPNVRKVAGNMQFTEGPVWINASKGQPGHLIFSDIPANHLKKWTSKDGVTVFRDPSQNANGNTIDRQGRLLTAEHSGRRVSITHADGSVHTVVDAFEGKKLNSPNDVVVKSDGSLWFTDPDYGLGGKPREQDGNYVYRFVPDNKSITTVARDFVKPNGLCFSPDEKLLYIADSGSPRHIRVFDVQSNGTLSGGKVFCEISKGGPDGIRCDAQGRIWSSTGHGAQVFAPDGNLIATVQLPEGGANLCFGGPDGHTVFITARTSLYAVDTRTQAASRPE
jgi:gluconolactonase